MTLSSRELRLPGEGRVESKDLGVARHVGGGGGGVGEMLATRREKGRAPCLSPAPELLAYS